MLNHIPTRSQRFIPIILLTVVGVAPAMAQATIGGHIGFAFPLVTTTGPTTTTLADNFSIAFPVGISVKGSGPVFFDLEFVPLIQDSPRQVSLTVHPGLLWSVGHGVAIGGRLAFDVTNSVFGVTGVVNKSWPIHNSFFKAYFVEADLPVRFSRAPQPIYNSFGFNAHFGVGF